MDKNKAFSLIELLVVMAIIAILAAIAIPQYNKYRANAFYAKMETNLKNSRLWAEQIYSDYGKYPQGICNASIIAGSGSIKCAYNPQRTGQDDEICDPGDADCQNVNWDLIIDTPLMATFNPKICDNGSEGVEITIECPVGRCSGLEPNTGTNAKVWINSCENPETIHAVTSLFNTEI